MSNRLFCLMSYHFIRNNIRLFLGLGKLEIEFIWFSLYFLLQIYTLNTLLVNMYKTNELISRNFHSVVHQRICLYVECWWCVCVCVRFHFRVARLPFGITVRLLEYVILAANIHYSIFQVKLPFVPWTSDLNTIYNWKQLAFSIG